MSRKRAKQYTEREAQQLSTTSGRLIEALTDRPMGRVAALKRIPEDGFLIYEEDSKKFIPAVLSPKPRLSDGFTVNPVCFIKDGWDSAEHQGWDGPGWYFWDETQAYCHGPFQSEEETKMALELYAEELEHGPA